LQLAPHPPLVANFFIKGNTLFDTLTSGSVKTAMSEAGAKSADLWMVPITDIRIMDDFNVRSNNAEYTEHIEFLTHSILANGFMRDKPLSVFVAKEGGKSVCYVVDGHSRYKAAKAAIEMGAEIDSLPVVTKPSGTQIEDLMVGLVTSNSGKPLSPIEKAAVCKRLVDFGMDEKTIAKRLGFTAGYVYSLLKVIGAPAKIRKMVESGQVSAANAVEAMNKHGAKAAEVLSDRMDAATAKGKKKVTKAVLAPKVSLLDKGLEYIKQNGGGLSNVAMLAHLTGKTKEQIQELLSKGKS